MATDPRLKIQVSAQNNASGTLKQVGADVAGLGRSGGGVTGLAQGFELLGGAVGKLAGPLGIAFTAGQVVSLGAEMVKLGEQSRRQRQYFDVWSGGTVNATTNLNAMKAAIGGTVVESDLLNAANKFLGMGLATNSDELAKLSKMAVLLGGSTRTASESMEEFALLLANQSILRLDTFGISGAKVRTRMEELKAATAGLSTEQAFMSAVMEEGGRKVAALEGAGIKATSATQDLGAAWQNLKTTLGEKISPTVEIVVRTVAQAMNATNTAIEKSEVAAATVAQINAAGDLARLEEELAAAEIRLAMARRAGAASSIAYEEAQVKALTAARDAAAALADLTTRERVGLSANEAYASSLEAVEDGLIAMRRAAQDAADALVSIPYNRVYTPQAEYGEDVYNLTTLYQGGKAENQRLALENYNYRVDLAEKEADAWEKAQKDATTKAARDFEAAYEKKIGVISGLLDAGLNASINLSDLRTGKSGGATAPGANGAFEDIYRLQAWLKDGSWSDVAAKYGIGSKEQGTELIRKFQTGLWDDSVTAMFDTNKLQKAVLDAKAAEEFKRAFAERLAKATGANTDVISAAVFGDPSGNTGIQTTMMKSTGATMADGVVKGVGKAIPELEDEGYKAAMAYRAGWNRGMNDPNPPTGGSGSGAGSGAGGGSGGTVAGRMRSNGGQE